MYVKTKERVRIWLQNPPRVQWVILLTRYEEHGTATARTWFDESEYGPESQPPPEAVQPLVDMLSRIAAAALIDPVDGKFQVKIF